MSPRLSGGSEAFCLAEGGLAVLESPGRSPALMDELPQVGRTRPHTSPAASSAGCVTSTSLLVNEKRLICEQLSGGKEKKQELGRRA